MAGMMMKRLPALSPLLILAGVLGLAGCAGSGSPAVNPMTRYTLEYDGMEREYFVFTPSAYGSGSPSPVAFFMHGYGGSATGTEAEVTNGLTRYAERFGYVMVFPQSTWFMSDGGPGERWEVSSWNHISDGFDRGPEGPICKSDAETYPCPPECGRCGRCGWASCNDDVGFLKRLFERVAADFAVDEERFYVSGFSNGAMMANRIACEASDYLAAVALVGGRVEPGFECTPAKPLPLLQINGALDDVVPADGAPSNSGYLFASTVATAQYWNDGAECNDARSTWQSQTTEGEAVRCTITCAASERESIDCLWADGNHRWPGTPGLRGSNGYCVTELQAASMPDQTICIAPDYDQHNWGSQLLFEFFDRH